jgi:AcrR family transcriptional regulator
MRAHAESNRARILAVASQELATNPDVTLEELAKAAGVARRTLYGHFAGRSALLEALAEEAAESVSRAVGDLVADPERPDVAFARFVLAIWPIADRYRLLLALARRDLGNEVIAAIVSPAALHAEAVLRQGQAAGIFQDQLPAPALNAALAAFTFSLMESGNDGTWSPDHVTVATSVLAAAGVTPDLAADAVQQAL